MKLAIVALIFAMCGLAWLDDIALDQCINRGYTLHECKLELGY